MMILTGKTIVSAIRPPYPYGGEFVSVVERAPVYGLQSHPEKSVPDGLRLLKNFVGLARSGGRGPRRGQFSPAA